ncbi:unnamed protein product, partial [Brassica napus]
SFAPIPKSDERFATQYRCGPPPEFPLASPRSGIVHHLSGPDRHAHTRTLLRRSRSVGCAPVRDPANQLPCALRRRLRGRNKSPGLGHHLYLCRSTPRIDRRTGLLHSASDQDASPAPIRFPPDNFKHSLTVFSKSFSSLPRGTCSLSVSRPYLALDGIYRPIGAAFPNNPTRRQRLVVRQGLGTTGLSPSLAPLSRELGPGPSLRTLLQTTIQRPRRPIFKLGSSRSLAVTKGILSFLDRTPDYMTRIKFTTACQEDASDVLSSDFGQPRAVTHGDQLPSHILERMGGRFVTPRQTCPRPEGLGRNLRSKTRWFTDSAIHTKYRILPRSSSMREPRYPLPRVAF